MSSNQALRSAFGVASFSTALRWQTRPTNALKVAEAFKRVLEVAAAALASS